METGTLFLCYEKMRWAIKFATLTGIVVLAALFTCVEALANGGRGAELSRVDLYFGLAQGNYLAGDLGGARHAARETLKVDPGFLPATALLARIWLDEGRPAEALPLTRALVGTEPGNHEYRLLHALVLERMGETEAATAEIETVLAEAPAESSRASTARQLRGLQHMAAGDWESAAAVLGGSATAGAADRILAGEAYAEAAAAHQARGEYAEARTALDTALELAPAEARAHRTTLLLARARLHGNRGRHAEAQEDLEAVLAEEPAHLEAAVMLASLCAAGGRWDAVENLLPVFADEPGLRDITLYFEGRAAYARDRIGTARARFEEALDLLAGTESALLPALAFYRGACLLRLGRTREGDEEILGALEDGFAPETAEEAATSGTVLLRAGRAPDAVALLEPAALREPEQSARLWTVLGRAHEAAGENALALSAYDEAVALDPGSPQARALRASVRREVGDLGGAIDDYRAARKADPDDPALAYALGLAYFQAGRIPEAERNLAAAAAALPDNGAVQLLHALCAYAVGDRAAARLSLMSHRQARPDETVNASALLLRYCLDFADGRADALATLRKAAMNRIPPDAGLELLAAYFAGETTENEVLDTASRAVDRATAARQFSETAFWMAQHARIGGHHENAHRLLEQVARAGDPGQPEVRVAVWMLAKDARTPLE